MEKYESLLRYLKESKPNPLLAMLGKFPNTPKNDCTQGFYDPCCGTGGMLTTTTEELEPLSKIIAELNTQFGTDFNENDKVCILVIEERLSTHEDLEDSLQVNKNTTRSIHLSSPITSLKVA